MQDAKSTRGKGGPFGKRFREVRVQLHLTQEHIARQLGVTTATYNRYEKGHREPMASLLLRMVKLAPDINAAWLLTGVGEPFGRDARAEPGLLHVPLLRDPGGVGPRAPEAPVPSGIIAFGRDWVRNELKCDPDSLFLLEMAGDSMSPTILPGELMLVRQGAEIPAHDGIHVLRMGGAIQVRRLQWLSPNELEVLPDNPLYKSRIVAPSELREDGQVMGRVVWSGKRH